MPIFKNTIIINELQKEKERELNISNLGQQVALEKLSNIQKDATIKSLGEQLTQVKLQLIQVQGGI